MNLTLAAIEKNRITVVILAVILLSGILSFFKMEQSFFKMKRSCQRKHETFF